MIALLRRAGTVAYPRYLAVSVAALAVDLSAFLWLRTFGLPLFPVSALSYAAGVAVHWLLSSRLVFAGDLRAPGAARAGQQTLFVLSALAGLAATVAVVTAASVVVDPRLAKLAAVAVSFQLTWLLRSRIVFA